MHPQSTVPTSTPGPSYFKAVADLQRAIHDLMDANMADPYGYIAVVAAECGGLAAEQRKLRCQREAAPVEADPRRRVYEIVTGGVSAGLPLPQGINIPGHYALATVLLPRDDKAGVDAWTSYLNLPTPALDEPLDTGVSPYAVTMADFPAVPGWHITVQCFCTEAGA